MNTLTRRIEANGGGRDFVVGDVHGCFRTLERVLADVAFEPDRDRLFSVGDLVDRGPHSEEAIDWLVEGRFTAVTMGNHENALAAYLLGRSQAVYEPWWRNLMDDQSWIAALRSMPLAITVETAHGDVGVIHAGPVYRNWTRTVEDLNHKREDVIHTALLGGYEGAGATWRGKRGTDVKGARAVITGHQPRTVVEADGNWWQIDTGAGAPGGRLSLVQIDGDSIVATTVDVVECERAAPRAPKNHRCP